jgi:hypothetical protein
MPKLQGQGLYRGLGETQAAQVYVVHGLWGGKMNLGSLFSAPLKHCSCCGIARVDSYGNRRWHSDLKVVLYHGDQPEHKITVCPQCRTKSLKQILEEITQKGFNDVPQRQDGGIY